MYSNIFLCIPGLRAQTIPSSSSSIAYTTLKGFTSGAVYIEQRSVVSSSSNIPVFLDEDNSINIIQRLPKSFVLILALVMEGTVSQISYLGPSFQFISLQKLCSFFFKCFPIFGIK